MENFFFWSEIGQGFEELGGTLPPRIPRSIPPPGKRSMMIVTHSKSGMKMKSGVVQILTIYQYSLSDTDLRIQVIIL